MNPFIAKAIIIDDEAPVRRALRSMLASLTEIEVVGEAGNVTEGLDLVAELVPDLLFLDIKMPIRSGFDLLDDLTKLRQFYGVIFVSGYPDEAIVAVQKAAPHLHTDFVIKPIDPQLLQEKVRLFYAKWTADKQHEAELMSQLELALTQNEYISTQASPRFLIFQNSVSLHRIDILDIMYCESANRQINVYCSKQEHYNVPNLSLDVLEKLLPEGRFIRIGKSHILNKEAISYLEKTTRPRCKLVWGDCIRELPIYSSNVDKIGQSYS